jgi:hypothetical protein
VTVEEVATLARTFGWSYETLMAMPGAERRLWLAAAARGSTALRSAGPGAYKAEFPPAAPPPASAQAAQAAPRMLTDEERKARLMQLHEELNHRGRKR